MKKQMAYADAKNCPAVVLLGTDEAAKGVVTVKNLKLGKQLSQSMTDKQEWIQRVQVEVPLGELTSCIQKMLNQ
jgi:histidyl-tRNA synthetase